MYYNIEKIVKEISSDDSSFLIITTTTIELLYITSFLRENKAVISGAFSLQNDQTYFECINNYY